jgi:F0F1-type ATP synthase assembly protein I
MHLVAAALLPASSLLLPLFLGYLGRKVEKLLLPLIYSKKENNRHHHNSKE